MAAPDKDTSALFLSGSVVLIAALGGYLWYQAPLKSARPANPGLERHEAVIAQRALARLWQDPLAAVDEHLKTQTAKRPGAAVRGWQDLAKEVDERLGPKRAGRVAIFLVMTDGSSYVEGTEQRIRDRYAIGSALSVACYVPEDGDRVGYLLWNRSDPPNAIPFEWYRPRKTRTCTKADPTHESPDAVLVLWLSDELVGGAPLKDLQSVLNELNGRLADVQRSTATPPAPVGQLSYALIGPTSSSSFRDMVQQASAGSDTIRVPSGTSKGQANDVQLFAPWVTVSSELVYVGLHGSATLSNATADEWVHHALKAGGLDLRYRIPSDFLLTEALVHELSLRGVAWDDPIALLAEWDSFYGRNLPFEFIVASCMAAHRTQRNPNAPCPSHLEGLQALSQQDVQRTHIPWVHQYSYLRGLDGEIPGGESGGAKGKPSPFKRADRTVEDLERPEGESQLDYVRRLANRLEADAQGRPFRAIGILGSDVYDKLLILQALRKRFPHTLFFTTDLDARLLHPSQYDWTHNLIVASHFGLELHPDIQKSIPPFRSSYQSSTFLAMLHALGGVPPPCNTCDSSANGHSPVASTHDLLPHLYELGRTETIHLPDGRHSGAGAAVARMNDTADQPDGHRARFATRQFLLAALALLCILALAIPVVRSVPDEMLSPQTGTFALQLAMLFILYGTLATLLFQWVGSWPDNEPFYWLEGVSVWPTELIRLLSAGLCIGFLRFAQHMLDANERHLTRTYGLVPATEGAPQQPPGTAPPWYRPASWSVEFTEQAQRLTELWHEQHQVIGSQWRRILPQTLMLGVLSLALLVILGFPYAPTRGAFAWWINGIILSISSLSLGLLIFYVVDAIRVCTGFIHQFALEPTRWPAPVLQSFCALRKVQPEILSEWLDIRFIAERTQVVGSLIHYPIIGLFLSVIARNRIFDDWAYPPGLLIIYGVSAAYVLICAILLSMAAEKARRSAVSRLRDHLFELRGRAQEPGNADRCAHQIAQVDLMLQDIQGTQQGAFAHWTQHPVFQALLLPSGGFSILALLDYFLTQ